MPDIQLIPLSALQHYAFCPRQCALIHIERVWADNWLTAQGNKLHKRVDSGEPEVRDGVRMERAVLVSAEKLGLTGKLDLVEKDMQTGALTPVEYKRGKAKPGNWDKVQLCAQALCLEEMTGQQISAGYLWYWETRRRDPVEFDQSLRSQTLGVINEVKALFSQRTLPKPVYEKRCNACSLYDQCEPKLVENDNSAMYVKAFFSVDKEVSVDKEATGL